MLKIKFFLILCLFIMPISVFAAEGQLFPPKDSIVTSLGSTSCPSGEGLRWDQNNLVCDDPTDGVTTKTSCSSGEVMTGLNKGVPVCAKPPPPQLQISCRTASRTVTTGTSWATVSCNGDEFMMGGGALCRLRSGGVARNGYIADLHDTYPRNASSWAADCYRSDGNGEANATVFARCCRFILNGVVVSP